MFVETEHSVTTLLIINPLETSYIVEGIKEKVFSPRKAHRASEQNYFEHDMLQSSLNALHIKIEKIEFK